MDCALGKKDARKVLLETSNSPYINKNTKKNTPIAAKPVVSFAVIPA